MSLDDILWSIRPRSSKIKLGWPHYLCGYGIRHASSLFYQTFRKITRLLLFSRDPPYKRALRIMCGAKYSAHTESLLKGCNILKIEDIFKLSCLQLYHKYINCMLPSFFNNIFTMNTDIHSYETRDRDNLHYFPYNREGASKRIRHSMPNLINLLSADVRLKINSLDLKQFVSFYKSITIASYDANCTIPGCYVCDYNWGICDY